MTENNPTSEEPAQNAEAWLNYARDVDAQEREALESSPVYQAIKRGDTAAQMEMAIQRAEDSGELDPNEARAARARFAQPAEATAVPGTVSEINKRADGLMEDATVEARKLKRQGKYQDAKAVIANAMDGLRPLDARKLKLSLPAEKVGPSAEEIDTAMDEIQPMPTFGRGAIAERKAKFAELMRRF